MGPKKISVSIVSYTNSKPFLFGLNNSGVAEKIKLSLDTPAQCAGKLISGEAAVGLVPVAAIEQIPNAKLITDFGIAATGKVESVLLLSEVPIDEIKTVLLDYQSITSVKLVKVLATNFWNINFEFEDAFPGYEKTIKGPTAGVVIGDRALEISNNFKFIYDLSEEWFKLTQLPFVFAAWVTNTKLTDEFLNEFNAALNFGVKSIDAVAQQLSQDKSYSFNVKNYLAHSIKYYLTDEMKQGMKKFLQLAELIKK